MFLVCEPPSRFMAEPQQDGKKIKRDANIAHENERLPVRMRRGAKVTEQTFKPHQASREINVMVCNLQS